MKHNKKTNAARKLDELKIDYKLIEYAVDEEHLDAVHVAQEVGMPAAQVFKTLCVRPLTGYIRGGCSPLGAKKNYPVYMDVTSNNWPEIAISAGQRGMQIVAAPADLQRATNSTVAPLIFA